jgi:16S rRNA C967 or C1407 C5-methylase (RsmB/RsmF family)
MPTEEAIIDEMLEPLAEALTPDAARLFANLKAPPSVQARVNELAAKCNEGELTEQERADYEKYVRVGNLFALIKAKAKRVIAESSHG